MTGISKPITTQDIIRMKQAGRAIAMLTAYDFPTGAIPR